MGWISCPSSSLGCYFIGMTRAGAKFCVETNYQALWQFGKSVRKKITFFVFISRYGEFYTFWAVVVDVKVEWHRRQQWEQGVGVVPCSWNLFHAAGGWHKALKLPNISFSQTSSLPNQMEPLKQQFPCSVGVPIQSSSAKFVLQFPKNQGMGKDLFLTTWNSWRILTNITHWNYLQCR